MHRSPERTPLPARGWEVSLIDSSCCHMMQKSTGPIHRGALPEKHGMGTRAKTSPRKRVAKNPVVALSRNVIAALAGLLLALFMAMSSTTAAALDEVFPLEPPDTTSPRSTLFNLIDNIAETNRILDAASRDYQATPGLFKSDAVLAQEARAKTLARRAAGSLDLSDVRPALLEAVRLEAVLQLKEVLDRIRLPATEAIPDAQAVKAKGLTRWRVPHTSIDIVQVTEGPRAGEFLFSPETIRRANAFYQQVKHLPYLTAGTEGIYQRYISTPGRMVAPKWSAWVADLPELTQSVYYGKKVL